MKPEELKETIIAQAIQIKDLINEVASKEESLVFVRGVADGLRRENKALECDYTEEINRLKALNRNAEMSKKPAKDE